MKLSNEIEHITIAGFKKWKQWRKLRKAQIKETPFCEICGWDKKLEGHHIKPRNLFPELALIWSNVIILCDHCHFTLGHWCNYKDYNREIRALADAATSSRLKQHLKVSK